MPVTVTVLPTDPALPRSGGAGLPQDGRSTADPEDALDRVRLTAGGGLP
ncbi:hypothetical protein [Citricoccus sp. CH26A]|nr:hypothetical protein [Citricoccus sp. CH26A]